MSHQRRLPICPWNTKVHVIEIVLFNRHLQKSSKILKLRGLCWLIPMEITSAMIWPFFGHCISADNDTRAAHAFIREQNWIIGASADGVADHSPDKGHMMKCNNNALYKLAKDNPSIRGVHVLGSKRINMLNSDISATLVEYSKTGVGDNIARQACCDQLDAIVL